MGKTIFEMIEDDSEVKIDKEMINNMYERTFGKKNVWDDED